MEQIKLYESLEAELTSKIQKAIDAAPTEADYLGKMKMLSIYKKALSEHGLSSKELIQYENLMKEIEAAQIVVATISEYRKLLETGKLPEKVISEILNHENAHANMAEQMESQNFHGYKMRFTKDENRIEMHPSAITSGSPSFPIDQIIKEEITVTEAPLYYGGELSRSDMDEIKRLKNKLNS